jgi:Cytochrome P460/Haem-binding domain
VKQILQHSCYNCHSNQTRPAWFDEVAPAWWLVTRDVKEARKHVNFSEIGKTSAAQQRGLLFEAVNQVRLGAMPLPQYRLVHPDSVVTPQQLGVLERYLNPGTPEQAASGAETKAADAEYEKWIRPAVAPPSVQPAPNGIAFLPDYKNWKTISSTERFDNHTLRAVLGNDVAVQAIAANHINPWPDGTTFAKVAWWQQTDDQGIARTGAFLQVEFMIRDGKKYADTKGWGWARWRGADLKPYGKDAAFSDECIGCHTPVSKNDYVYTLPIRGQP